MDPAAPVTRTTLPWSEPRIWLSSRRTGCGREVFDGDIADLGGESVAFDNFRETGDRLIGYAGFVALLEDIRHLRAVGEGMAMRTISMFWAATM